MTLRDSFFADVDKVLDVLQKAGGQPGVTPPIHPWKQRRVAVVAELRPSAARWEDLVGKLGVYDREVLLYVARLLRAREAQVARRAASFLGSSRGAGFFGVAVGALALTGFWGTIRTWLPFLPAWVMIIGFLYSAALLIALGWGALAGAHPTAHLLYLADLLDAVVALKDKGILRPATVPAAAAPPV